MIAGAAQRPEWANLILDYHFVAAFVLAAVFPLWRFGRRKYNNHAPSITTAIALHQAATGFILPSFILLIASPMYPPILQALSGHEMGLAGIFGFIVSARELCVHE